MALFSCPECNQQISDKAQACPKCGFPVKEYVGKTNQEADKNNTEVQHTVAETGIIETKKFSVTEKHLDKSIDDETLLSIQRESSHPGSYLIPTGAVDQWLKTHLKKILIGTLIFTVTVFVGSYLINEQAKHQAQERIQKAKIEAQKKVDQIIENLDKSQINTDIFKLAQQLESIQSLPQKHLEKAAHSAYQLGLQSQKNKDLSNALQYFEQSIKWNPQQKDASKKIAELKQGILNAKYLNALGLLSNESWEPALKEFRAIIASAPGFKDVQTKISYIENELIQQKERARQTQEKEAFIEHAIATKNYQDLILRYVDLKMNSDIDLLQLFRDQQEQNAQYDATMTIQGYKWVSEALLDNPRKIRVEYQSYPTINTMRWCWIIDLDQRAISLADSNQDNLVMETIHY